MEDSVQVACVIPNAADTAFQIYSLKRSAYAAVVRAFCAQSDILSRGKVRCLTELRNELKILQTEHAECLVKARSNKQIKSFSAGLHSKGNTCSTEVLKDFLGLACVLPNAGDTVFQIHCLERSAYASVLRAFCAVTNHLSLLQVKLLSQLKNELRISHSEHKEVLMKVSLNEHIKSLRKFSLANLSVVTKTNPAFDVHAVLHDKIGSTGQVCTSSTSCLSLIQQSPVSENSMSSTRDIGISDSSNGAKEGPYFESHTVVSAKRLKTVNGHAPEYLKCVPSNQLPVAVSAVMVEKHSQLNAGQSPVSVDHARQESGKRKTVVPEMSVSESLGVMDRKYEIEYQKPKNKDSDLEHGSEIIKLCLTASLLNKVERIFKENPDSTNLEKAKLALKAQEKDLLDALAKLSEVSYDVVYFGANHNHGPVNLNEHDDGKGDEAVLPKLVNSSGETSPETRLGDGGTENKFKIQGIASVALSPSAATPTGGTASSSPLHLAPQLLVAASSAPGPLMAVGPTSTPSALCKKRSLTKFTAEQKERMLEFAERFGWRIHKAGAEAVDNFCAQIGVPQRVFKNWMYHNRRLAKIPPSALPSHHQDHSASTAQGPTTEEDKSPEAEVAVSADGGKEDENEVSEVVVIPPSALLSHHQDHLGATAQESMTEEDKSPEAEVAVSADGGKEDENEVSEVAVIQPGMGHRARKPNKRHRWPESKDKRAFGAGAASGWPRHQNEWRPLDLEIDDAAVSSHIVYIPASTLTSRPHPPLLPLPPLSAAARASTGRARSGHSAATPRQGRPELQRGRPGATA